jgi:hypothetical protein
MAIAGMGAGAGFAVMPGMSGMAWAGCGTDWRSWGAGADFFGPAFFAGGFLAGIAMPGMSSIFMPSIAPLPDGGADCAVAMADNNTANATQNVLATRMA